MKLAELTYADWKLERFLLGELPTREMKAIREEVKVNELLRERISSLEASTRDLLALHPPEAVAVRIREGLQSGVMPRRPSFIRPRFAWALVPVAAGLVLAIYPVAGRRAADVVTAMSVQETPGIRVKTGQPYLRVFRRSKDGVEELSNSALASPKDVIQIKYRPGKYGYGAILSVDGRGAVTVHHPLAAVAATEMEPGQANTLDHAYELDDAPHWERFYLITSDSPFLLEPVVQAARQPAGEGVSHLLAISSSLTQTIFELRKVPSDGE